MSARKISALSMLTAVADIPEAQGFDAILAIGILSTIYLFKRRYN